MVTASQAMPKPRQVYSCAATHHSIASLQPIMKRLCPFTRPQSPKPTLSALPDELLLFVHSFNAATILDIQDLDQYLRGARTNKAIYRCAIKALCRRFNVRRDIQLRDVYDMFTNVEIWAGSFSHPWFLRPMMPKTRAGSDFPARRIVPIPNRHYVGVGSEARTALTEQKISVFEFQKSFGQTRVVSFDLRIVSSAELRPAWNEMVDIMAYMPSMSGAVVKLEAEQPAWSDLWNPGDLWFVNETLKAFEEDDMTVKIIGSVRPDLKTTIRMLERGGCQTISPVRDIVDKVWQRLVRILKHDVDWHFLCDSVILFCLVILFCGIAWVCELLVAIRADTQDLQG